MCPGSACSCRTVTRWWARGATCSQWRSSALAGREGRARNDWRVAVPRAVAMTASPAETMIFHFLLPADGMATCTDKVVKALEPAAFEKLKRWRSDFMAPLTSDEIRRVKALDRRRRGAMATARHGACACSQGHQRRTACVARPGPNRAPTSTAQKDARSSARCCRSR
jgi:hypothetical protein